MLKWCNYSISRIVIEEVFDNVELGAGSTGAAPDARDGQEPGRTKTDVSVTTTVRFCNCRFESAPIAASPKFRHLERRHKRKNGPAIFCFARPAGDSAGGRFACPGQEAPSLVDMGARSARIWPHLLLGHHPSAT